MQSPATSKLNSAPPRPEEPAPELSCWWPKHHEENWAAKSSSITRITGWLILSIQALIIVSIFFTDSLTFDLLSIVAGFGIIRGSQAWLRFNTFTSTLMACASWIFLTPALLGQAVELEINGRTRWFSSDDLKFWSIGVAFAGVITMEAVACILCLRTRNLNFWTKTAKRWGGIVAAFCVLGLALKGVGRILDARALRGIETKYQVELSAIRADLAHRHPSGISSTNPSNPVLHANPEIRLVMWESLKNGRIGSVYSRETNWSYSSKNPAISVPHRLPSGEHGNILIYLDGEPHPEP